MDRIIVQGRARLEGQVAVPEVRAQAEEEAERIVQLAQDEATEKIEDHEIISSANQRAQTVLERAQREAEVLKIEADEYAREVLVTLDEELGALDGQIALLLTTVRNGLETLTGAQEPTSDAEE